MFDKISYWWHRKYRFVSAFVAGVLWASFTQRLEQGQYAHAAIDFLFLIVNIVVSGMFSKY